MKTPAVISVVLLLALGACGRTAPPAVADFEALEQRWMDALAERQMSDLEQLLASDFTIIGVGSTPDDLVSDRAGWLANATRFPWPRHTVRHVRTKLLRDTAVVHGVLAADYPPQSITPEGGRMTFLITDVWVWRDGRWQVTTRHSSIGR
jgi:hypothetical protein